MCKKPKGIHNRIDECLKILIKYINDAGLKTRACCCGHGKYPMTIIVEDNWEAFDIVSGIVIPRTRNFYKKDKKGFYFIPEVSQEKK